MRKGSGNIVIRPASGPDIVIPVTDRRVRVGGVGVLIDATADLAAGTAYHVRIDAGAFEDLAGNDYAGIADANTWRFTTKAADTTAPTLYRRHGSPYNGFPFTPVSGATTVQTNEDLYIYFTEPVRKGSGNIVIRPASGPDIVIPVTDKRVEVHKNQKRAAIYATGNGSRYHTLQPNTAYHVRIDSGAFEDWSGNDYPGIADATTWNFTTAATDTTAPTVSSLSPPDGATGVPVNAHLVLTFSEKVHKGMHRGSGNIVIRPASGPDIVIPVADSQVSVTHSGSRVTIDPAADLAPSTAYHVRIETAAFEDRSGNDYAGISDATTWNFTTGTSTVEDPLDITAPTLESLYPVRSVSDDLVLNFSEPMRKGSGNIVIRPASGSDIVIPVTDSQVSISGDTVTVNPTSDLAVRTAYRVLIAAGVFEDLAGNAWAGIDDAARLNFTTATRAPVLTGWGGASGDDVAVDTTLQLFFSAPVRKGSGNIVIRPASGSDIVIPVTDSQVSVSGRRVTIDPASDLAAGTAYHVLIANGAIENLSGDAWAGISDATFMTFTTAGAPTVSSFIPADGATDVSTSRDLVLNFNKSVRKGSGIIEINGPGIAFSIQVTDGAVSVSGRTVTIDPPINLAAGTAYHVRIPAGAFEDLSGNDYAGIADATTWNFTTAAADTTAPTVSSATVSGTTLVLTYDEALDTGSTPTASAYRVNVSGGSGAAPSSVSISGSAVTLILGTPVTHGQTVTVSYTKPGTNPVQDSVGHHAAALTDRAVTNDTPDTAPTVSTYSPADDAGDVAANAQLVLTFSEPVRKGSGDIVIRPASGPDITVPVTGYRVGIYGGGTRVIIDYTYSVSVLAAGTDYHVRIPAGAFESLSGNEYAGIADATTWNFTTAADTSAPTVSSFSPADGATDVGVGQYLFLNFSEQVRKGSGDIVIRPASGPDIVIPVTDSRVSVWDSAIQISHDPQLAAGTDYHVRIPAGAFEDLTGNDYAGIDDATTWNFTTAGTADTAAPTVSSATVNGATLAIIFSERLAAAAGLANDDFAVKKTPAGGSEQTVPLHATTAPSISGATVTLTLAEAVVSTDTGVKVSYTRPSTGSDNRLKDAANNEVATFSAQSVTNNTAAADTTAPTVSTYSPADDETAVAVDANLVLTFSEPVRKGSSGFVIIRPASGPAIAIVATDSQVSVSGRNRHHRPHRRSGRRHRLPSADFQWRDRGPGGQSLHRNNSRLPLDLHHRRHHGADIQFGDRERRHAGGHLQREPGGGGQPGQRRLRGEEDAGREQRADRIAARDDGAFHQRRHRDPDPGGGGGLHRHRREGELHQAVDGQRQQAEGRGEQRSGDFLRAERDQQHDRRAGAGRIGVAVGRAGDGGGRLGGDGDGDAVAGGGGGGGRGGPGDGDAGHVGRGRPRHAGVDPGARRGDERVGHDRDACRCGRGGRDFHGGAGHGEPGGAAGRSVLGDRDHHRAVRVPGAELDAAEAGGLRRRGGRRAGGADLDGGPGGDGLGGPAADPRHHPAQRRLECLDGHRRQRRGDGAPRGHGPGERLEAQLPGAGEERPRRGSGVGRGDGAAGERDGDVADGAGGSRGRGPGRGRAAELDDEPHGAPLGVPAAAGRRRVRRLDADGREQHGHADVHRGRSGQRHGVRLRGAGGERARRGSGVGGGDGDAVGARGRAGEAGGDGRGRRPGRDAVLGGERRRGGLAVPDQGGRRRLGPLVGHRSGEPRHGDRLRVGDEAGAPGGGARHPGAGLERHGGEPDLRGGVGRGPCDPADATQRGAGVHEPRGVRGGGERDGGGHGRGRGRRPAGRGALRDRRRGGRGEVRHRRHHRRAGFQGRPGPRASRGRGPGPGRGGGRQRLSGDGAGDQRR